MEYQEQDTTATKNVNKLSPDRPERKWNESDATTTIEPTTVKHKVVEQKSKSGESTTTTGKSNVGETTKAIGEKGKAMGEKVMGTLKELETKFEPIAAKAGRNIQTAAGNRNIQKWFLSSLFVAVLSVLVMQLMGVGLFAAKKVSDNSYQVKRLQEMREELMKVAKNYQNDPTVKSAMDAFDAALGKMHYARESDTVNYVTGTLDQAKTKTYEAVQKVRDQMDEAKKTGSTTYVDQAKQATLDAIHKAKEAIESLGHTVKETVTGGADTVKNEAAESASYASQAKEATYDALQKAKHKIEEVGQNVKGSVDSMTNEAKLKGQEIKHEAKEKIDAMLE